MARHRQRNLLFIVAIVAVCVAAYGGGVANPFMFDDMGSVVHNTQIRSLAPDVALQPPAETPVGGRPLVNLSFAVNYAIGGVDPVGYRAVNIALHALNAILVFLLLRLFRDHLPTPALAGAIALLWAAHPLNSEAVNYVTQRTEQLMATCFLLTMYASARAADRAAATTRWTIVAIAACAAGMACKETMVVAPIAVVLCDRIYRFGSFLDAFRARRGLYLGLVATWGVLGGLMATVPRTSGSGFATTHVSTWTYLLNQTEMLTQYLRLALWPDQLVLYYGWATPQSLSDVWPYALLIVGLLAATVVLLVRAPKVGFLAFWCFLVLAPTSSVVPIGSEVGAERRMYLPMIGVMTLLGIGVHTVLTRQRIAGGAVAAGVVVVGLTAMTYARTEEYQTALGMAQTVLARWPTPTAHYMVGTELVTAGRVAEAIPHLRQASVTIPPARFNLGSALFASGQRAEGVAELEAFLRAEPGLATARDARLLLARGYAESGRVEESLVIARQILTTSSDDFAAHALIAEALVALGRFSEAVPHFEAYLRVQSDDGAGWTGLGIAHMQAGRGAEGVTAFSRAVATAPNHAGYRMNLARALLDTGQAAAAIEHAQQAVALTQGDPAAVELLARARQK